ncbi:MAG: 50S ribosomal protein L10 [Bdellovibrionales bacterium]
MDRQQKENAVKSVKDYLGRSKAAFLVDFKGLNVEQVTSLRKKLRGISSELKVVRNTLAKRAIVDDAKTDAALKNYLVGTNAFVFAYEDVSASAKLLVDFAKDNDKLEVKVGVMEGTALDKGKITTLARLPSKDVLRAQLLGVLAAPMSKFVRTLAAVPSGFVRVLDAKAKQS